MVSSPVPRLRAVTRPIDVPNDLLRFADPEHPLVWLREDRGLVGVGEALRLAFRGRDRFREAARAWRAISDAAEIDDPVNLPGSGLLSMGIFSFDDRSAQESVLIVPRVILARRGSDAWVTRISETGAARDDVSNLPGDLPFRAWDPVTFPVDARDRATDAYLTGVAGAADRIARGEAEKIVLARQVSAEIDAAADLRAPLAHLFDRYLDCWTFAIDGMIGASPETLVRYTDGRVTARVLAGTRPRGGERPDAEIRAELLASAKEQREHAFSVRSVVDALTPHVTELEVDAEPFALELPNVWHLATDVTATPAPGRVALDLVEALHPTAAVAGTPTPVAVQAIAELEPFDRGRYTGAAGWLNARGEGEWVIALRCAHVAEPDGGKRTVTASAGGGIVAGSSPERELIETEAKFRPISEAFSTGLRRD